MSSVSSSLAPFLWLYKLGRCQAESQGPSPAPSSWSGSKVISLSSSLVPSMTGRPLAPRKVSVRCSAQPKHCSHSVLVLSRDGTGIPTGTATIIQIQLLAPSFQRCFGVRVCSRPGREAGAEISQGLCQMLQAPSEQLGLIWVFLHSHAVQSQVLVSDYRGCSWGCFQCREHVLKLLKHSHEPKPSSI